MPEFQEHGRPERPNEGFHTRFLAKNTDRPVRMFLPTDYQPRYAYPLVVLLHGHGGNEEQISRLAPQISRRNYITISLRGTEIVGRRPDGRPCCGWVVNDALEDYFLSAVNEAQRAYHVHAERLYLIGFNEGADAAYRLGFAFSDRVGGIAAINGRLPQSPARLSAGRSLSVLLGHGSDNPIHSLTQARKDCRKLQRAGNDVRLLTYPTSGLIHPNMLRDINRWIIGRVNQDTNKRLSAS